MIWIPRPKGDFDAATFFTVLGILVVCLLVLWWYRRRKRNDPDRGGPGYVATATPVPAAPAPDPNPLSAEERWLLGFAAPRVVFEELDAKRWDLGAGAMPCAIAWEQTRARFASDLAGASSAEDRAFAAVEAAWWVRVGVATGHLTEAVARNETRALADSLRRDADDWLVFGDLLGNHEHMVRPRVLYRTGAPWADPRWPRRR